MARGVTSENPILEALAVGHFGDHKRFEGLIELSWHNGLRVYCFRSDQTIVVVLNGGSKNGQDRDIQEAQKIRAEILAGVRSLL